jgi:fatty acid desaturase
MGKGGQHADLRTTSSIGVNIDKSTWKSPYNPVAKNAPELPTKGEIRNAIPKECFERSYFWSMFYLARDYTMATAFVFVTSRVLSTDLPPNNDPVAILTWVVGWSFYAFWMGTIMTGPWVLAHECGHGAFSPSQPFNDFIGNIVHHSLLVPYFAWQYTHAKHHRRTNHLTDGESHVPSSAKDVGLGKNNERLSFYAALHDAMGDGAFAVFQIWAHLGMGWPMYLLGHATTGKLSYDGKRLEETGAIADHFRPNSPMFIPKVRGKILFSTLMEVSVLCSLIYAGFVFGHLPVILWYWCPYFVVNAWLVLYTWLQHCDPSVPQYGDGEWTWVRGALSTIDRPYGIFDFFHHTIGSTHVAHHLFHEMPWYNAGKATTAIKAYLEPKGLYNYDPTWWPLAMWRIAKTCHYVETDTGIQYFKSLQDVPRSHELKKNLKHT